MGEAGTSAGESRPSSSATSPHLSEPPEPEARQGLPLGGRGTKPPASRPPSGPDPAFARPADLGPAPRNRYEWERPTAWLLGVKLFSSLRDIVLSGVYNFDLREWMTPGPPEDLTAKVHPANGMEAEGAWIDFLSDTGDSPRLVYQLTYLLLQEELTVYDGAGEPLCFAGDGERSARPLRPLPRGSALIFGGDTAYPVADYESLVKRVRDPMWWAYERLKAEAAAPRAEEKAKGALIEEEVPLYGIPANHDYYNALQGFVRGFRKPLPDDLDEQGGVAPATRLRLPGYRPAQEASYFALRLPYGWQLWGLDIEGKPIDDRQRRYFREANKRAGEDCSAHIVVTSQPTMVYHRPHERAQAFAEIFHSLGLSAPFFDRAFPARGRVQLDLSGDFHLYERYWGQDDPGEPLLAEQPTSDGSAVVPGRASAAPVQQNYASVVSGLGGAFHHPTQVRCGDQTPRRSWPPTAESARAIGALLLRPRKVFQAGAVGVVGALLTGLCCALLAVSGHPEVGLLHPFNARALSHLGVTAASILTLGVAVAAPSFLLIRGANRRARAERLTGSLSQRLARAPLVFWGLRWLGISRDNFARSLRRALPYGMLAMLLGSEAFAAHRLVEIYPQLSSILNAATADPLFSLYLLINVLVLGMAALGPLLGGGPPSVQFGVAILGAFTALLLLWTPYMWTVLLLTPGLAWGIAGVFAAFALLRWGAQRRDPQLRWMGFHEGKWSRRLRCALTYLLFVLAYAVLPVWIQQRWGAPAFDVRAWGYLVAVFFGAYFACQWVGWYFLLALQWSAHGNGAGVTARVDDYAQFLRIKLTKDQAEVWAIAAVGHEPDGSKLPWRDVRETRQLDIKARLVDHFVVKRR